MRRLYSDPSLYNPEPSWTPANFASVTLVGYYDAEDNTKITNVAGKCSAWVDSANAVNSVTQATGASQPSIVATHALTGRQVLQFDGTDDQMTSPGVCPYAVTGELSIFVVGVQDALVADTTTRYMVATGVSTTNGLMLKRVVASSTNRFQTTTGNGAGGSNNSGALTTAMNNRFFSVGVWATTTQTARLNGIAGLAGTAAMFGDTTRFRIGASAAATPAGFWHGAISAVLYVTGTIGAQDLNNFAIWSARRLGGSP